MSSETHKNSQPRLSVVLTCYNEKSTFSAMLEDLMGALQATVDSWEVIIFDDASSDGSAALIEAEVAGRQDSRLRFIARQTNAGFVANILDGVKLAHGRHFWVVCADRTVPREAMHSLFSRIGEADIVIPHVQEYANRGLGRRIVSRAYSAAVRLLSGSKIKYFNGGSIFLREDFARELPAVIGFGYSAEIILKLVRGGRTYVEVPVTYREGEKRKSTAISTKHFREIGQFLLRLLIQRFRSI